MKKYSPISIKTCKICGSQFEDTSRTKTRKYCSPECQVKAKKNLNRIYEKIKYKPKSPKMFTCVRCGGEFPKTAHNQKRCESCREALRREARRELRIRKSKKAFNDIKNCKHCHKQFTRTSFNQKYCPNCREKRELIRNTIGWVRDYHMDADYLDAVSEIRVPAKRDCMRYDRCLTDAALSNRKNIFCNVCGDYRPKEKILLEASIPCSLEADGIYAFGESGVPAQCNW